MRNAPRRRPTHRDGAQMHSHRGIADTYAATPKQTMRTSGAAPHDPSEHAQRRGPDSTRTRAWTSLAASPTRPGGTSTLEHLQNGDARATDCAARRREHGRGARATVRVSPHANAPRRHKPNSPVTQKPTRLRPRTEPHPRTPKTQLNQIAQPKNRDVRDARANPTTSSKGGSENKKNRQKRQRGG